jgi:formate dehydrogenase major subunit
MTNHWRDIRNTDMMLIVGANPAECHPVGFRWFMDAKINRGAKIVHVDPRFTRTSAVADIYARIRTGTDIAFFGALINYVLQSDLINTEYVRRYTNAPLLIKEGFEFKDGLFTGYDAPKRQYDMSNWNYELGDDGYAKQDLTLQHPRSVYQMMKKHYERYTPEMQAKITGIPADQFLQIAKLVGEHGKPDKVMTVVYAVGLTHHTTGGQMIRSAALLQLLLGNMGMPGGGMNAERGHANIQGNTDNAISWENLPGYLRIPSPGQKNIDDYIKANAAKKLRPDSLNYLGTNYKTFLVSTLKAWYGDAATKDNDFAFNYLPKPAGNSSWLSIFNQANNGKLQGYFALGMSPVSIGPDVNRIIQSLSKLKWLVVMDPFPNTTSEFWHAPGIDPKSVGTEVFMLPATHWIEKDGSFTNSGRWAQWKEAALPPEANSRHDHWIMAELLMRVRELYQKEGGKFPDPIRDLTMNYKDPRRPELDEIAQEINGYDLTKKERVAGFSVLKDDGTTSSGNWIYAGSYPQNVTTPGGLMARRKTDDPTGLGFFHEWAFAWPANRRILYNRASADFNGQPWDPKRVGIKWDDAQKKWVGDVPDYPATQAPGEGSVLPFIMTGEGSGRLFSGSSMIDGPFPEHYEPMESPIENPLHPQVTSSPVAFLYDGVTLESFGKKDKYPYVATTYRLTEHEHYLTQWVPHLVKLQPEAFAEIPQAIAKEKGIKSGDMVRVFNGRGKVEVRALVTNRLGPVDLSGQKVYQIGIPIHWGFVGVSKGDHWLTNSLSPYIGDVNARTPEFKSFLVNVEKIGDGKPVQA